MIRIVTRALSLTMRMARGTATMLGLAVMLAVVLGVSATALAAVPGDPFRLGQNNLVDGAITSLVGSRAGGAMMLVDNNSSAAGSRALDLRTEAGRAPLTVSPGAGKAPNFDADKLDGKDSAAFLGKGDKAFNSDRLDGLDSFDYLQENERDDFLPNDIYTVSNPVRTSGGGVTELQGAFCDGGDAVLSGGGGTLENDGRDDDLLFSSPNGSGGWTVTVRDNGAPSTVTVEAVCADLPPLRP